MTAQSWEPRVSRLEGAYEQVDKRLDSIQFDLREFRSEVALRFNQVDARFNWLIGIVVGTWLTTIGVMVGFFESISSHLTR